MRAEYRRDLQNNYLILEMPEGTEEESYQMRMAQQNEIIGLLPFHCSARDGKRYLHYEITSMQALGDVYERSAMQYQDIVLLLTGIEAILKEMQKYLLNPGYLIFDPRYIYLEPGRKRIWLCYLPGDQEEFSITLLAEFILKKLDHEEDRAVMLGYSFYQSAVNENFSLQKTLKALLTPGEEKAREEAREEVKEEYSSDFHREESRQSAQSNGDDDAYEVNHRERNHRERRPKEREKISSRLFQIIHPGVLLSSLFLFAALEVTFYFGFIHLTEAGGLFFLLISVEILINKYWKKTQEKKKAEERDWDPEEEDEMYRMLQEEMYEKAELPQEIEETCCLTPSGGAGEMKLVFLGSSDTQKMFPDITIGRETVYVGKMRDSDVILDSPTVSRMHARLEKREDRFYIRDLNSKNGTFHNGRRLEPQEQCEITSGDRIMFAEIQYRAVYFTRNQ